MSRLSWLRKGNSCRDEMLLCRDRVVQHGENLCLDRVFLRRDRKSQDIRFPCRDIALCHDNGVRHCVSNMVGCMCDRGSLPRTTKELCRPRQSRARMGCAYERGASATDLYRSQPPTPESGALPRCICTGTSHFMGVSAWLGSNTEIGDLMSGLGTVGRSPTESHGCMEQKTYVR